MLKIPLQQHLDMFDQISGYHSLAKLIGKINRHRWLHKYYFLFHLILQGISLKKLVLLQRCVSNPKVLGTFEQLSKSWMLSPK